MRDFLSSMMGSIDAEESEREREREIETVNQELDTFFSDSESRTELSQMGLSESQVEDMMDAYYKECGSK